MRAAQDSSRITTHVRLPTDQAGNPLADPLSAYRVSDVDSYSDPKFYGFLSADGAWYILKENSTAIAVNHDSKAIVLTSLTTNHDLQAAISSPWAVIHDTRAIVATALTQLHDTLADISTLTGYVVNHDTRVTIATALTQLHDVSAAVSSGYAANQDVRAAISQSVSTVFDTLASIYTAAPGTGGLTTAEHNELMGLADKIKRYIIIFGR